ncbi:hypothetical protein ROZALSC1DRAFT_27860 [Rozella allomycis CSF55]|uniref:Uncharacterized protein n=1 Tax=Rozella allomycis (strain CSF55) TaxID=988480 RepID=A0A075APR6_ROZAC|nr:hypothetical protein O9G_002546 [Rozella allomycis CSF55]RKP20677.1 hypothetical protein ROZALSC1DRAFT_27860 [Rozella allomycis CSF55]|eukprot:EPZ32194.1 hypothetical protein O9G_002546 [Rozella allomycis CSF55]
MSRYLNIEEPDNFVETLTEIEKENIFNEFYEISVRGPKISYKTSSGLELSIKTNSHQDNNIAVFLSPRRPDNKMMAILETDYTVVSIEVKNTELWNNIYINAKILEEDVLKLSSVWADRDVFLMPDWKDSYIPESKIKGYLIIPPGGTLKVFKIEVWKRDSGAGRAAGDQLLFVDLMVVFKGSNYLNGYTSQYLKFFKVPRWLKYNPITHDISKVINASGYFDNNTEKNQKQENDIRPEKLGPFI